MSLVINHNMMAANAARTLNTHYGNLATSTQRLSSGLRINSAADDAAGLAIRELMRADIAAYNQGIRNANDAISMIQVVDGALGIIDEKLIRMKELAEQAATGTYDSTQRLMIDSEFQAMASEIQRIATATDFNGIKLIDSNIPVQISKEEILENLGIELNNPIIINTHTEIQKTADSAGSLASSLWWIDEITTTKRTQYEEYYLDGSAIYKKTTDSTDIHIENERIDWNAVVQWELAPNVAWDPNQIDVQCFNLTHHCYDDLDKVDHSSQDFFKNRIIRGEYTLSPGGHHYYRFYMDSGTDGREDFYYRVETNQSYDIDDVKNNIIINDINTNKNGPNLTVTERHEETSSVEKITEISNNNDLSDHITIHFGPMNDAAEDYYDIEKRDCTLKGLGLEDVRIETQDKAQEALVTINDAIVKKDHARAYYGAMQNRLENTVSNLTIQAENLQASESRISDVDVATEMTNFVRNQILTQSAVAMLSQANSMPQMAMQLIG